MYPSYRDLVWFGCLGFQMILDIVIIVPCVFACVFGLWNPRLCWFLGGKVTTLNMDSNILRLSLYDLYENWQGEGTRDDIIHEYVQLHELWHNRNPNTHGKYPPIAFYNIYLYDLLSRRKKSPLGTMKGMKLPGILGQKRMW